MTDSNERTLQIIEMRENGTNLREIGSKFGISFQRVHQILGRWRPDLAMRWKQEVQERKALQLAESTQRRKKAIYARWLILRRAVEYRCTGHTWAKVGIDIFGDINSLYPHQEGYNRVIKRANKLGVDLFWLLNYYQANTFQSQDKIPPIPVGWVEKYEERFKP